ncbi:MAG: class I SAM-dependent methyltransferase [Candidatus Hermodarchaeota archaeon]|nr:class I SAM-dependent methyltransferase [Candidatus Hermodarchaeota archaeon]
MSDPAGQQPERIDFGRVAEDYETTRGIPDHFMKELLEDIISTCGLTANTLVLDLGCGAGRFLRELTCRKIPAVGIDISKGMLEKACLNQQSRIFLHSYFVSGDAVALPFQQGLFTGILAIHLFHLLSDWQEALSETLRVLKPGGTLLTGYVEGVTHGSFLTRLYRRRRVELGYVYEHPGVHPSEIIASLRDEGATIETHQFSTSIGVPVRQTLTFLDQRVFSSMWRNLPDVVHRQIMQEVRASATSQFKNLEDTEHVRIHADLQFVSF